MAWLWQWVTQIKCWWRMKHLGPFCLHRPWSVLDQYAEIDIVDLHGTSVEMVRRQAVAEFGPDYQQTTHLEFTECGTFVCVNDTEAARRCQLWSEMFQHFPVGASIERRLRNR